jgi:hypothetical protein
VRELAKPIVFCVLGLLALPAFAATSPAPPSAPTGADRRADIATFRDRFLRVDRSYSAAARAEAERRLAKLDSESDTVSQIAFELELARVVALADNGHTMLFAGPLSRQFDRVEVRLAPFGEDFFVLRASEPNRDILGARLLSVDGHAATELRDAGRLLLGGTPAHRDRQVSYFLESPQQLHACGLAAADGAATYRFRLPDGSEVERRLTAEPANPERARGNADRWLYPQPLDGEGPGWHPALAVDKAPWSLRDPDIPFRMREAPDLSAMVVELRQNNDSETKKIADFIAAVTARLRATHPENLVLDMRMNGGGDLTTTRELMQSLPKLVPGRIFALTSPWTFSAAISSVGYLEQAAPDRVTIVGEPVGDRLNFFSEGTHVELPKSGLLVSFATERHDYETGCRPFKDCHHWVVRYPIAVKSLAPDIAAPWTIDAYLAGRDPAMEAVAAALAH